MTLGDNAESDEEQARRIDLEQACADGSIVALVAARDAEIERLRIESAFMEPALLAKAILGSLEGETIDAAAQRVAARVRELEVSAHILVDGQGIAFWFRRCAELEAALRGIADSRVYGDEAKWLQEKASAALAVRERTPQRDPRCTCQGENGYHGVTCAMPVRERTP